jgi:hypothetical protein
VFLLPDGVTLDGMPHRRKYNIWFVQVITGSMLPPYELLKCNKNIFDGYAKAMFTTACCLLLPTAYSFTFTEKHICHRPFFGRTEQGPEQK